jgi:hypothetical protein
MLALPPIISMAHVFLAIILFLLEVNYKGDVLILFALPIVMVIFIHLYIAIVDSSMSKNEHIGYALIHIPFSITFSFLALLLFIPKDNQQGDVQENNHSGALFHCANKHDAGCLNNLYQRNGSQ